MIYLFPIDPFAPELLLPVTAANSAAVLLSILLFGWPLLAYTLILENIMDKNKFLLSPFTLYQIGMRLGIFVFLSALPLYYYPGFHQWYAVNVASQVGTEFWLDLTVYNALRYGGVHMPTFFLMFFIAVAAVATPHVARITEGSIEKAILWIQTDLQKRKEDEEAESIPF
jgi:hypothetical protein